MGMILFLFTKRLLTVGDRSNSFRAVRRRRNFIHKRMREQINQYHERTEKDKKHEYKRENLTVREIESSLIDMEENE